MYLPTLLRIKITEAGWLLFVILGVIPAILFRSWGAAILYYVAVQFIWAVLETIARRAVMEDRDVGE